MKIALRIWFLAVIAECILYSILEEVPMGLFVLPFALIGGAPGMLMLSFLLDAIDSLWEKGKYKWIAIGLSTLATANGTLVLFLLILRLSFNELPFFPVLNASVIIAFILNIKAIKQNYFNPKPQLIDVEKQTNPYQFKNIENEH